MASVRSWFIKHFVRLRIKPLLRGNVSIKKIRGRTNYLASYGWYPILVKRERFRVGEIDVAAYSPRQVEPRGTILFVHGGGFCFGSIRMYADLASRLAAAAQARVVLPEYRLSPEHRYPAAHEDVMRVYEHLLNKGSQQPLGFALVGDSAGGALVMATAIAARDRGLPLPDSLAVISPWVDLTCGGPTYAANEACDAMLTPNIMSVCSGAYAHGADVRDPRLSPLFADLKGLPPLLIQVGTDEILLSDSTRLADAARAAGLDVTLRVYEGLWHVWHLFAWAVPEGKLAIRELAEFVTGKFDTECDSVAK
ncbi:MAG: alpha/beta hydrolase [Planctomycetaceae bacterium]